MFGANRFRITDGSQVELLIPVEQFALVGEQRHDLSSGEMNMKEFLRALDKFFHTMKIIFQKKIRQAEKPALFWLFFLFDLYLGFALPHLAEDPTAQQEDQRKRDGDG